MNDILNKLYYGEINPSEMPPPATKRYNENLKTICSIENKLLELYPECKELLDDYTDALRIEAQLESEADFERGFRLGAQFAAAVLGAIE